MDAGGRGAGSTRWVKSGPKLSPERGEGDGKGLKGVPKMRPNESRSVQDPDNHFTVFWFVWNSDLVSNK